MCDTPRDYEKKDNIFFNPKRHKFGYCGMFTSYELEMEDFHITADEVAAQCGIDVAGIPPEKLEEKLRSALIPEW